MPQSGPNPFLDPAAFNSFAKFPDLSQMMQAWDMSKFFGDVAKAPAFNKMPGLDKLPSVDMDPIISAHRKNLEALAEAQRFAFESAQDLSQRYAEMARQAAESFGGFSQSLVENVSPEDKLNRQADFVRGALERTLASLKELTSLIARNQCQALDVVGNRVCQSLDEVRSAFKNKVA